MFSNLPINRSRRVLPILSLCCFCVAALVISNGSALAQNRLFLTVDQFTGGSNATDIIGEVDLTSDDFNFETIFTVPTPPNGEFVIDGARDLIVDEQGNIQVYNGTFMVSLLSRDVSDGSITQAVVPGLSSVNATNFGGIARQGDTVFLSDQSTFGDGDPQGIVRVDLENPSFDRIATDLDPGAGGGPLDINISLDGSLLAVVNNSDSIFRYNSQTGELLNEIMPPLNTLRFLDIRGVAGLEDGTVIASTFQGNVLRFNNDGEVLGNLFVDGQSISDRTFGSRLGDIDVAPDGQVAIGTSDGDLILTTTALESFEVISISDQLPSVSSANIFVAFASDFDTTPASVPEPSSGLAVVAVGLPWLLRRRKSAR